MADVDAFIVALDLTSAHHKDVYTMEMMGFHNGPIRMTISICEVSGEGMKS